MMIKPAKRTELEVIDVGEIDGLKLIKPKVFPDDRGFFSEVYNKEQLASFGFTESLVQINHSYSKCGVLRGLHAQPGMGKLVSVISGRIFDVGVDIRPESSTFGQWHGEILDDQTKHSYWIPDGFLHGFYVLSEEGAHVMYQCSAVYNPHTEFGINPLDPDLAIDWHIDDPNELILSERDGSGKKFKDLTSRAS